MPFDNNKLELNEPRDNWTEHDILMWTAFRVKAVEEKLKTLDKKHDNHLKHHQKLFWFALTSIITLISVLLAAGLKLLF